MKYQLDTVLKNEDGTDAVDNGKAATMRAAISRALISDPQSNPPSADKKLERFTLFSKIATSSADVVDLTVDDVALAKEAINIWPTLLYGQLVAFLDQRTS